MSMVVSVSKLEINNPHRLAYIKQIKSNDKAGFIKVSANEEKDLPYMIYCNDETSGAATIKFNKGVKFNKETNKKETLLYSMISVLNWSINDEEDSIKNKGLPQLYEIAKTMCEEINPDLEYDIVVDHREPNKTKLFN